MTARPLNACLACGYDKLGSVIDLGYHPLANGLLTDPNQATKAYPLALNWCPWCSLLQLSHCVDRAEVFPKDYPYRSGVSHGWKEHCTVLARRWPADGFTMPTFLDIGGNDGTAAQAFRDVGYTGHVVDPVATGPSDVPEFFTAALARMWLNGPRPIRSVILAQNVLAHVEDPVDFLVGIELLLHPQGVALIECPAGIQDFTQIYHEHVTYWSLRAMEHAASRAGLVVTNVEDIAVHGGSIRYTLRRPPLVGPAADLIQQQRLHECGRGFPKYLGWQINHLRAVIQHEQPQWAIGASAKLATILSVVGPNSVAFVVDDTPEKQGKYLPTGQPILPPQDLSHVGKLLIGAPNWTAALKKRAGELGFKGQFVVPFAA